MLNPNVVTAVTGVSGFLGFLSLLAYLYFKQPIRGIQRSIQQVVSGDRLIRSADVLSVLERFSDDGNRLAALREITHHDAAQAHALLAKVKDNLDVERLNQSSTSMYLRRSRNLLVLFVILAGAGFAYSAVGGERDRLPPHPAPSPASNEATVDFSAGESAPPPHYRIAAAPYLKDAGISIASVTPAGSSLVIVNNLGLYEGKAVHPASPARQSFLTQVGTGNQPASFTLLFTRPLHRVSITRPALYAEGESGVTHPAWSAHALGADGRELGSVSEALLRSHDKKARENITYTLHALGAEGIAALRVDSDPHIREQNPAAFSALLIERLVLTAKP